VTESKAPASYQRPSAEPEVKEGMAPIKKISYGTRIAAQPALLGPVLFLYTGQCSHRLQLESVTRQALLNNQVWF